MPPACSYQDGTRPEGLSEYATQEQLRQLPSLLQYFSYLFAAGSLLAGPHFDAHDYYDYIDRKVKRWLESVLISAMAQHAPGTTVYLLSHHYSTALAVRAAAALRDRQCAWLCCALGVTFFITPMRCCVNLGCRGTGTSRILPSASPTRCCPACCALSKPSSAPRCG